MRLGWIVVALCGCYHPDAAISLPCSASGACPANQLCDLSRSPPLCVSALADARPFDAAADAAKDAANTPDAAIDGPATAVPITFVQAASVKPAAAVTALAFPGSVIAKDAILICLTYPSSSGATLSSVTDTGTNVYTTLVGPVTSGGEIHYIIAALDAKAGPDTVTVTLSATVPMIGSDLFLLDYSGIATTAAFDATSNQSGTGTAMTSGGASTTAAHELILGFAEAGNASVGTGFTSRATLSGNLVEDEVVNTTGTYAATGTTSGGATWTMIVATFKGL
jgi:hypothetical protein